MLDIHLRIYDVEEIKKLKEISLKQNTTQTALCKELVEKGINFEYERIMNVQEKDSENLEFESWLKPLIDTLKEINEGMKNLELNKEIQNSMLAVMYKQINSIMNNQVMDTKAIELGLYDSLPARFIDRLDELIKITKGHL